MIAHHWQPIQKANPAHAPYDFGEIDSLQRQWLDIKERQNSATAQAHAAFLERLGRRWAIETGIIEGLYTLDRGVTESLIQSGIFADHIERSATDQEPQDLVRVLKDHEESIALVHQYIRRGKSLTRSFIRQLHQVITRHQDTYTGVAQFGRRYNPPLDKGGFKKLPNNPTRPDGSVHQYCPPEQVDSEIDNLLYFYNEMQQASYHPILTGAWLHHAFTQIHPFQDGNGRVVRALLTWHLVKENYLPIVISRDGRSEYIRALELADSGDLNPFVDQIVQLERWTILQAISEPEAQKTPALVDQVLDNMVERINRQRIDRENQMRSVNGIAAKCRDAIGANLENEGDKIRRRLFAAGMDVHPFVNLGGPDRGTEHYYSGEVGELSSLAQHQVNWSEPRFFARLSLRVRNSQQPRLVFVICLYPTGRNLTGIMAAAAFARIEPSGDSNDDDAATKSPYYRDCAATPLTFNWRDNADSVNSRFAPWTEASLSLALQYWQESMT